jgi:hypothetical protein
LSFELEFPFHPSGGGADYYVLHGLVTLEDGQGLHAPVAVHMSQTVKEALPSVDEAGALAPSINAIRKATDTKDIEFLKSDKRQPIALSSRAFSLVTRKFTFQNPTDDELFGYLKRAIYWRTKLGEKSIDVSDPVETLYLARTGDQMFAAAKPLASEGWIALNGTEATASAKLMNEAAHIEDDTTKTLDELNAKHAYERG